MKVATKSVIEVGNIKTGSWKSPQYGRIYSTIGLSPSLTTMQGGGVGREPKIVYEESEGIRPISVKRQQG